jgi:hypothetical protein
MTLMNRGLETKVILDSIPGVSSNFRLQRFERIVGGTRTQTFEQIYGWVDGCEKFQELCEAAIAQDFEHRDAVGARIAGYFDDTKTEAEDMR